jgi:hypothetical protein
VATVVVVVPAVVALWGQAWMVERKVQVVLVGPGGEVSRVETGLGPAERELGYQDPSGLVVPALRWATLPGDDGQPPLWTAPSPFDGLEYP